MAGILWLPVLVLVLLLARFYRRVWRQHRLAVNIPGPKSYPLIGNAPLLLTPLDRLDEVARALCAEHGYLFKLWLGPLLAFAVLEPEDLQVVLTSHHLSTKPAIFYQSVEGILGKGLITTLGSDHKRRRRALTASMHFDILQEYVGLFSATCRQLEARLDRLAETGEVFDVEHDLGCTAASSVCQTVLTFEDPSRADRDAIVHAIEDSSKVMMYRCARLWFRSNTLFRLSSWYERYHKVAANVTNYADRILAQKIHEVSMSTSSSAMPLTSSTPQRRMTFLDRFLSSSEAGTLSRTELLDELKTLLFTGIGTSQDFQSIFLLCMALHPDVQRKVQEELDIIFAPDTDRDIVATDLPHMKYLECTLKEALRLYPPAAIFCRVASQDVPLPSGHVIPEDSYVAVVPNLVHRNPRHYSNPDRFDPGRFTPENSRNRHPYAFIPFSAGPRNCIGQKYAIMYAKVVAASVLRRYDVLPDPAGPRSLQDVRVVAGITISIKGGVRIRLHRRRRHS